MKKCFDLKNSPKLNISLLNDLMACLLSLLDITALTSRGRAGNNFKSGGQASHQIQGGSNKVLQKKLLPLLMDGIAFHYISANFSFLRCWNFKLQNRFMTINISLPNSKGHWQKATPKISANPLISFRCVW